MKIQLSNLFDKIKIAFEQKHAFVVYSKPHETSVKAQFLSDDKIITPHDFKESGFVFAPFDAKNSAIFFPLSNSEFFESEIIDHSQTDKNNKSFTENTSVEKKKHLNIVASAIEAINTNTFKKVVLSRKEEVKISNFDLIQTYQLLLQKYPSAMVYCWFHPEIGLWMGATPELFCKVENNYFSTVALAGTQLVDENKTAIWTAKEQIEQQLVTDFIVNELKEEIQNLKISTPYSVKAGHLWHIKTDIEAKISAESTLQKIIQKLHPTPAVCGFPKNAAKDFILQNEGYNREFYTGYLGEINLNTCTELFVNLRCMKIMDKNISIFVGGGITKDSIPEKEWDETVAKAFTMKKVLL